MRSHLIGRDGSEIMRIPSFKYTFLKLFFDFISLFSTPLSELTVSFNLMSGNKQVFMIKKMLIQKKT